MVGGSVAVRGRSVEAAEAVGIGIASFCISIAAMTGVPAFGDGAATSGFGIMTGMSSGERLWAVVVGGCAVLAVTCCCIAGGGGATPGSALGGGDTLGVGSRRCSAVVAAGS